MHFYHLSKKQKVKILKNGIHFKSSKIFLFTLLIFFLSACSKHPSVEEGEHDTYHDRAYSTQDLQARYEHILKKRKTTPGIAISRGSFKKETKNTFDEIDTFKKDLQSLTKAKRSRRVGKNRLLKGEKGDVKYVYSEGCVKSTASNSIDGCVKKDIAKRNSELARYY